MQGIVTKALPNTRFLVSVEIGDGTHEILTHLCGKMRTRYIRVLPGDPVTIELSPYDMTKGRIVRREKT